MRIAKYQALGNDYLVVDVAEIGGPLSGDEARWLCDRHFGVGADGVLLADAVADAEPPRLRILNPDGSEAEKSGNGLRIFARWLFDRGVVAAAPFAVDTSGGRVRCHVLAGGTSVRVEMGRVSFRSEDIPVTGPPRDVLLEPIEVAGEPLEFSAATLGNPHCVVLRERLEASEACRFGPLLEGDPRFPQRTNVQLVEVRGRDRIGVEIWERGAGYTLASGSSASAAAAVCQRLGRVDRQVRVEMPGGALDIEIGESAEIVMTGPVAPVLEAELPRERLGA